ncbi:MAG: hypothetical protein Q9168_006624 [Polycauliona sp. 1 TL-2023]
MSPPGNLSPERNSVRTENYFYVFYNHFACEDDPARQFINDTSWRSLVKERANITGLTNLVGDKPFKALERGDGILDDGFADVHEKLAVRKYEIDLIYALVSQGMVHWR